MATFHTHFPTPPERTHFDAHRIADDHPGAAALREYWREHRDDAPAVKPPPDIVANSRRAGDRRRKAQDKEFNDKTLAAWQMVQRDGLPIAAACAEVGIAQGTYRKRARRLELDMDTVQ